MTKKSKTMQRAVVNITDEMEEHLRDALYTDGTNELERVMRDEFNNDGSIIREGRILSGFRPDQLNWFLHKYKPDLRGSSVLSASSIYPISIPTLIQYGAGFDCTPSPVASAVRSVDYLHIQAFLEHGASLEEARREFARKEYIKAPQDRLENMQLVLDDFTYRSNKCQRAVLTVLLFKHLKEWHRDIVMLLAKMVWATRRSDVWKAENAPIIRARSRKCMPRWR